jgi:hypothetical protein
VNCRSLGGIGFGTSQDFAGQPSNVALTGKEELDQEEPWIAFTPTKVGMWLCARQIANVQQESGNPVGDSGSFGTQDSMIAHLDSPNSE